MYVCERVEDNMERLALDEARTTAAPCSQNPQHAAPPTAHNPTPLRRRDSTTLHTKSPDKPRECTREPRGWVRSETNSPGTTQ